MVSFKIVISDPKQGKCFQIEVKDEQADFFVGKKIGDTIKGDAFGQPGYDFTLSGGSDKCGFPMRKDVSGSQRKKILIVSGVGIRNTEQGRRKKRTVVGNTVGKTTSQINLAISKGGKYKTAEEETKPEDKPSKEEAKPEEKPAKVEAKTEEKPAEEKPAEEKPAEEKPAEEKPAKEEAKTEEKPAKEEAKPKEKPVEKKPEE
ncbi:30S ribosomal protein S6e [Candidatus Woesearchaeota archaeon]|nr:30S ribosomal protein S6e [Candidatus Woesearchaeota archaeon]